jgi:hypothetical protein
LVTLPHAFKVDSIIVAWNRLSHEVQSSHQLFSLAVKVQITLDLTVERNLHKPTYSHLDGVFKAVQPDYY